jgi:uncharacterized protein (DUF2235 family)
MKDILLFIDGTRQGPELSACVPTNVEGLAYFLDAKPQRNSGAVPRPLDGKAGIQAPASNAVVGYISGIGADARSSLNPFPAGTGYGMADTIRLAYKFLIANYFPDDRIFLFGFSRGAFAIRSLAGFVDCVGTGLRAVPEDMRDKAIDQAYFAYEYLQGDTNALRSGIKEYLHEYLRGSTHDEVRAREFDFASLPIYLIGIWDAVEALGLPSKASAITRVFNSYHQTKLPPNVSHAFHALALHELRSDFEPHVWTNKDHDSQVLEQRWFAGDHSDIGGGYSDRKLSDISLLWMLGRVESAGLTAVRQLAQHISKPAPPSPGIHQKWQDIVYCVLPPTVRQVLRNYDDLTLPPLLHSSFDPSLKDRLWSAQPIDYSQFRIGFGKTFGVRSRDIQIDALRQADRSTLYGLLRMDPRFSALPASQQQSLLSSGPWVSWSDVETQLATQGGQQAAQDMHQGLTRPIKISRPLTKKPPGKKGNDSETP